MYDVLVLYLYRIGNRLRVDFQYRYSYIISVSNATGSIVYSTSTQYTSIESPYIPR